MLKNKRQLKMYRKEQPTDLRQCTRIPAELFRTNVMHGRIASQFQDCHAAFHPAENGNLPFSAGKANYTKREMRPDL